MKIFTVLLLSYLIGNFSTSYFIGKVLKNLDIREYGSGNAGATNALRVLGIKAGLLTFIVDALKGVLAVYIGGKLLAYDGELISGILVVIGHNWPIFLNFKGGKGVATSIGVILYINPLIALIVMLIGITVLSLTKYVSLSSITGMALLPLIGVLVNKEFEVKFFVFTLIIGIMGILRHKSNIIRLVNGNESKIGQKV